MIKAHQIADHSTYLLKVPTISTTSYFKLPEHPLKIYIFFDIIHLDKTARNNFDGNSDNWRKKNPSKHKSEYLSNIIKFKGIEAYLRDVLHLFLTDPACHLKDEHIHLTNTSKMTVSLALPVLRHTTTEKLKSIGTSDQTKYPSAYDTGIVIEEMDKLFSSLHESKISGED